MKKLTLILILSLVFMGVAVAGTLSLRPSPPSIDKELKDRYDAQNIDITGYIVNQTFKTSDGNITHEIIILNSGEKVPCFFHQTKTQEENEIACFERYIRTKERIKEETNEEVNPVIRR